MKIRFLKDYTDERGRGFRVGDIISDDAYTRLPMHELVLSGTAEPYPPAAQEAAEPTRNRAGKGKKKSSA